MATTVKNGASFMVWIVLVALLVLLTGAVWWMNKRSKDVQTELDAEGIKSLGMWTRIQSNVQRRERDQSGPGSDSGPDRGDTFGRGRL